MRTVKMKWLYAGALSLLVVLVAGTEAHCDVVGKWNVATTQSALTKMPGQPWETTAFDASDYVVFTADGAYQENRGAVGTWTETGSYGSTGVEFSVDIKDYLIVMWHQILQSKGMEGTFEITSYSFNGVQNGWFLRSKLIYKGVAHVTSPVVMDVIVKGDAKFAGVPAVSAQ